MLPERIIVAGASAGGVGALVSFVKELPADIPAAIFVVLHLSPTSLSVLPAILERSGQLPASHPTDGEAIEAGHIYIAPPDHHLVVEAENVRLTRSTDANGHRPAVDTLFRSAAASWGARTIGVVLSGMLDDGAAGLQEVKAHGGKAMVQNFDEAEYSSMPRSAALLVDVDYKQTTTELARTVVALVMGLEEPRNPFDHAVWKY